MGYFLKSESETHTHTHIYTCVCVRACVCILFVRNIDIVTEKYPNESNRELVNLNCIELWKYVWILDHNIYGLTT